MSTGLNLTKKQKITSYSWVNVSLVNNNYYFKLNPQCLLRCNTDITKTYFIQSIMSQEMYVLI